MRYAVLSKSAALYLECVHYRLNWAEKGVVETPPNVTRVFNKDTLCEKMYPQMCEECLWPCWRAPLEMKHFRERREFHKTEALSAKAMPSCAEWRPHVPIWCLFLVCHAPKAPPVPPVQRAPSPHDGAFSAQQYTMCPHKYASTLTYTDSAIMRSTSCTRRRPRCIKAPSVPKGGALDMTQFPSLKYAFDHVAGIRAPLRGNGRAPTESEKHLYRIISSECIANSTKVLRKAYMERRLYAVFEGASSVETLPSVTRFF